MIQRTSTLNRTAATLVAALALGSAAQATLIAYDPFLSGGNRGAGEYTAGNDMRTMGAAALGWVGGPPDGFGVAHSGSTGNFVANATGEDSAAVSYEAGGRMQWIGVGNFPFDRNLTRQLNTLPASNEWWVSIQVNRLNWAGTPSANTQVVGGFTDAGGSGIQIGYDDLGDDGVPEVVLRSAGVTTELVTDSASNDNQLIIVQLLVNESGDDTMNLWIDPASVLDAADLTITDQNVTDSLTPFTQSKYESPGQSGVVYFDEIRLATSFEGATGVPEPASLALLGLGGLLLARRRRG